jgi:hypothetical protein
MGDIVITPASNDVNSTAGTLIIRTSDAQAMSLKTSDTDRVYITSAGNVGIGLTNPASKLHVSGAAATIMRLDSNTLTSVAQFQAKANTDGVLIAGMYGPNPVAGTVFGANTSGAAFLGTTTLGAVHPTLLAIGTSNTIPIIFGTNDIERMRIAGAGNVGIGTTNPSTKLHVYGAGGGFEFGVGSSNCYIEAIDRAATAAFINTSYYTRGTGYFAWNNGSYTERMRIDGAGNVGISTTSPTATLQVGSNSISVVSDNSVIARIGGSSAGGKVFNLTLANTATATTNNESALSFIVAGNYSATAIISAVLSNTTAAQTDLVFTNYNNGLAERMRINSSGNVGIGTVSPTAKLDVVGTIRLSSNLLSHKTASYTTSYPGISSFGADTTDSSLTYYDTGKLVANQEFRGVVWTGKHYIFTDHINYRAYFYDNNFVQIPNAYGYFFVTLPLPSGYNYPHGAAWDGRYLWCVVYTGAATKIVGYDLDTTNQTATIIAESAAITAVPYTFDIEYADGHLYLVYVGTLYIYKWNGSSIDFVSSYASAAGTISAQAITYDGSYLWVTQNGANIYKVGLDGTPIATITTITPNVCGWAWNGSNIATFDFLNRNIFIINTTRLRIDTQKLALMGGNVGIGTTSPVGKLTVQGNIEVNYNSTTADTSVRRSFLTAHATINRGANITFGLLDGGSVAAGMTVNNAAAAAGAYNSQFITFNTHEGGVNEGERMRITSLGNVGIGTFTPLSLLTVGEASSTTAAKGLSFGGDASANLYRSATSTIKTDGSLEVATSLNIGADLYVADELGVGVLIANKRVNYGAQISAASASIQLVLGRTASATGQGAIGADSANTFAVWNVSGAFTKQLVVTQQGNVGIGTDVPGAKLDVNGIAIMQYEEGQNQYSFRGVDRSINDWDYSGLTNNPQANSFADGSWFIDSAASDNWERGILSKRRFRRVEGLTLEYESFTQDNSAGGIYVMIGFVGGNSVSFSYNQTPANLIYQANTTIDIYTNSNSSGSDYSFDTRNAWWRFKTVLKGAGALHYVYRNNKWNLIKETSINNQNDYEYLRVIVSLFRQRIYFRDVKVYVAQQSFRGSNYIDNVTGNLFVNGSVGIGTTNPSHKLDIYQTSNDAVIRSKTTAAGAYAYLDSATIGYYGINLLNAGTSKWFVGGYGTTSFTITKGIGVNEYFRIDTNGNVGIGTDNPTAKLVVMGEDVYNYAKSSVPTAIVADSVPEFLIGSTDNIDGEEITLRMGSVLSSYYTHGAYVKAIQGAGVDYYKLAFGTSNGAAATTKMSIDNVGNVGIGITNPGDKFQVNLNSGENILANIRSNGVSANNKVSFRLSELGTPSAEFSLVRDGTSYQAKLQTVNNQPLSFGTNSTTRMVITGANVGIGTLSPYSLLDVQLASAAIRYLTLSTNDGQGSSNGFGLNFRIADVAHDIAQIRGSYENSAGGGYGGLFFATRFAGTLSNRLHINDNGRVGIGVSYGTTLLSVGGAGSTLPASGITFGANSVANLYRSEADHIKTDGSFVVTNTLIVGGGQNGVRILKNGSDSISSHLYIANAANTRAYNFQPNAAGTNLALWTYNSANAWQNSVNFNYNGSVGIGTTTPSGKLHIVSTIAGETVLRTDGTNGTLFSVVDDLSDSLMSVNNSAGLPVLEVFADDRVVAGQYGSGDFVLINNKIGIGTSNPANKLSVIGGASIGSTTYNTAAPSNGLIVEGRVGIGSTNPNYNLDVYSSALDAGRFYNNQTACQLSLGSTANTDYVNLIWYTSNGNAQFFKNRSSASWGGTDSMNLYNNNGGFGFHANGVANSVIITTAGDVGINKAAPTTKLDVVGSFRVVGTTNVGGIFVTGTSASQGNIRPAVNNGTVLISDDSGSSTRGLTVSNGGGAIISSVSNSYDILTLQINGTTNHIFDRDGNVGIGLTAPNAARLHIKGNGSVPVIRVETALIESPAGGTAGRTLKGWLPIMTGAAGTDKVYIPLFGPLN